LAVWSGISWKARRRAGDHLGEYKNGTVNARATIQRRIIEVTGIARNISCHASMCSSGLMVHKTAIPSFMNGQPGIGTSIADIPFVWKYAKLKELTRSNRKNPPKTFSMIDDL
jgi:hypothetical protein